MKEPEISPIGLDDEFQFSCHKQVPCFNHCCQDLNQALMPYDVLRLKNHLNITAKQFIQNYAVVYSGPATGLPVVSLRFTTDRDKKCPFVTPQGCQVYPARPSSCRIYPVARALQRNRMDGSVSEHYALLKEPHCRGFEEKGHQTIREWIASQELKIYNQMNDAMMELIAWKNQLRPGELPEAQRQMTQMAFYDLDNLKKEALAGRLPSMAHEHLKPLSDTEDDDGWLAWSLTWIGQVLFGKQLHLKP